MPTPEQIPALYDDDYSGLFNYKFGPTTELFIHLFRMARVRALRVMGVRGGAVLDVGCARGLFLRLLEKKGYEAHGTELSPETAAGARRFFGGRVRVGTLEECGFEAGQFDAVTAWQVFEHLRDPRATLAECHRILKPGGVVIFSVPNIGSWQARWAGVEWFHLDLPRHLWHYTPQSLTRLLESSGFRVELVSHYGLEQNPFGFLQSALQRLGARRMGVYHLLRGPAATLPRQRLQRLPRYALYLLAFPIAALVEYVWSAAGSGATFTILARRADGSTI